MMNFTKIQTSLLLSRTFCISKSILNYNNEYACNFSCPEKHNFALCSHGEKLPRQRVLSGPEEPVTLSMKLPGQ